MLLKSLACLCASTTGFFVLSGASKPVVPVYPPYPPAVEYPPPLPPPLAQPQAHPVVRQEPQKPAYRAVRMRVTACSPDDPLDQEYYSKNGYEGRLTRAVAADTRHLPRGTMLSIPGYAGGAWVPVDSAGGSVIRRSTRQGRTHIDVKFRSLHSARKWGSQTITVFIKD